MIDPQAVESALDFIRPFLQREGVKVELVRVAEDRVCLRLGGNPPATGTPERFVPGIERWLREKVRGLAGVTLEP